MEGSKAESQESWSVSGVCRQCCRTSSDCQSDVRQTLGVSPAAVDTPTIISTQWRLPMFSAIFVSLVLLLITTNSLFINRQSQDALLFQLEKGLSSKPDGTDMSGDNHLGEDNVDLPYPYSHRSQIQNGHLVLPVSDQSLLKSGTNSGRQGEPLNAPDNLHMTALCGHWQEEYIQLHNSIMEENRATGKENFLIFSSCSRGVDCGGFGDNMSGILSAFMLALLFRRAFLIEWNELSATEALIPAAVDWRMDAPGVNLSSQIISGRKRSCVDLKDLNSTAGISVDLNFINPGRTHQASKIFLECLDTLRNVSSVRLHTNRGVSHWTVEDDSRWGQQLREMGLRLPYISGCFLRFLFRLKPNLRQSVQRQVHDLTNPNKLSICIHSRSGLAGDNEYTRKNFSVEPTVVATEPLLKCAADLTDMWGGNSMGTVWFFMSGVPELKKIVYERHKDKVITTPILPGHTNMDSNRERAFESTAVEWYLFSKCNFFVFHESGLSKSSSMYSLVPMSAFMFSRFSPNRSVCDPLLPSSPRVMGNSWSGL